MSRLDEYKELAARFGDVAATIIEGLRSESEMRRIEHLAACKTIDALRGEKAALERERDVARQAAQERGVESEGCHQRIANGECGESNHAGAYIRPRDCRAVEIERRISALMLQVEGDQSKIAALRAEKAALEKDLEISRTSTGRVIADNSRLVAERTALREQLRLAREALRHVANLCHTASIQHKCESCKGHALIAEDAIAQMNDVK